MPLEQTSPLSFIDNFPVHVQIRILGMESERLLLLTDTELQSACIQP